MQGAICFLGKIASCGMHGVGRFVVVKVSEHRSIQSFEIELSPESAIV